MALCGDNTKVSLLSQRGRALLRVAEYVTNGTRCRHKFQWNTGRDTRPTQQCRLE